MKKKTKGDEGSPRCTRASITPTTPTSPSLNLMEQLLLAKMERTSLTEQNYEVKDSEQCNSSLCPKKKIKLLRTSSMDSQTSASTFSSVISNDSTGNNCYCKCDDCLLGIVDKHQQRVPLIGRKKVIIKKIKDK